MSYDGFFSGPIARHGREWYAKPLAAVLNMLGLGAEHIQAVTFPLSYGKIDAKRWLKEHDLKPIKPVHKTKGRLRYRIKEPVKGDPYITKVIEDDIQLILESPHKGGEDQHGGVILGMDLLKNIAGNPEAKQKIKELIEIGKNIKRGHGDDQHGGSVFDVLPPPRTGPSPQVQGLIEREGKAIVKRITVYRKPLSGPIQSAVNIIRKTTGQPPHPVYDKLFHLYMIVDLDNGHEYLVERNETYQIKPASGSDKSGPGIESKSVPLNGKQINFSQLIVKPAESQGVSFWRYDAFKNNCQDMLIKTLSTFGLLTSELRDFIKQNVEDILPKFVKNLVNGATNAVTDFAARFRRWIGQGVLHRHVQGGGENFPPGLSIDGVSENVIQHNDSDDTRMGKTHTQLRNVALNQKLKHANLDISRGDPFAGGPASWVVNGVKNARNEIQSGNNPILNLARKAPILGPAMDIVAANSVSDVAKGVAGLAGDIAKPGVSTAIKTAGDFLGSGSIIDNSVPMHKLGQPVFRHHDINVHIGGQVYKLQPVEPKKVFS